MLKGAEGGGGWRRRLCRRVVKGKVLKMDGPSAQGFLGLTGPLAPRVADCPSGNAYEVSVTDLPFCIIRYDKNSADWLVALATPYPGCAGLPPQAGAEQPVLSVEPLYEKIALRSFIVPPLAGERWWRQPPKGENAEMVREVYDSLFFPSYLSFPLEGKSHEAGKGVRV